MTRGLAIATLLATALLTAMGCDRAPGPSIVLVTLDTLRLDHVGAYGDSRGLTPHVDALAARGLLHENAFTTMPTTSPAHASLMTGLDPVHHGVRRNGSPISGNPAERLLHRRLADAGYATAAFVTTSILSEARTGFHGFDRYDSPTGVLRPGANAVEAALHWLADEAQHPVFLWVHLYDCHAPYGDADTKRRAFPVDPARHGFVATDRFSPEERAQLARRYEDGVRATDAALGALLEGVASALDDPVVIVVGDHGETLDEQLAGRGYAYDHGEFLPDAEVRIPLVLAGPGIEAGRSTPAASIRDVYTAVLAAAGIRDGVAHAEGRRDLREPSRVRHLVATERRGVGRREREKLEPAQLAAIEAEALLVTDGNELVVLDAEGRPTRGSSQVTGLENIASERLSLIRETYGEAPARQLDSQTREALRALGYTE